MSKSDARQTKRTWLRWRWPNSPDSWSLSGQAAHCPASRTSGADCRVQLAALGSGSRSTGWRRPRWRTAHGYMSSSSTRPSVKYTSIHIQVNKSHRYLTNLHFWRYTDKNFTTAFKPNTVLMYNEWTMFLKTMYTMEIYEIDIENSFITKPMSTEFKN